VRQTAFFNSIFNALLYLPKNCTRSEDSLCKLGFSLRKLSHY
jgi:hypothetical protein